MDNMEHLVVFDTLATSPAICSRPKLVARQESFLVPDDETLAAD